MIPVLAFNTVPSSGGDYFNHHDAETPFLLAEPGKSTIRPGGLSQSYDFYLSHNYPEPLTDVRFYLQPSQAETHAEVVSGNAEPYGFGATSQLVFTFDDREMDYTAVFPADNLSAAQVCGIINEAVGEVAAFVREVEGQNHVVLRSPSRGASSKVFIRATGSAAASVLGFPTSDVEPVGVGSVGNWGRFFGNGAWGKCVGDQVAYPVIIASGATGFRLSLNFGPFVEVDLSPGSYPDDAALQAALVDALEDAGFILGTHLQLAVSDGRIVLTSLVAGASSSVRVRPWDGNDATSVLGLATPEEIRSSYPNSSSQEDYNEIIGWGDQGSGLEIGNGASYTRIDSAHGKDASSAIPLTWGEGPAGNAILPFVPTQQGEVKLTARLGVPAGETQTGFREVSLVVEFVYS
ncbi:MAG: hypothetical protein QW835_00135 [Candidatus Hadarchaeum sp.]